MGASTPNECRAQVRATHSPSSPFDRSPGDAMRGFFRSCIARLGGKRVIEGLAVYMLRMRRKVVANCWRQIKVLTIGHHIAPSRT
jgi:hypothetical protein